MRHTITSRTLGRTLTFSRPGRSYIYVDLNGHSGTLGKQICAHGYLMGDTLTYSGDNHDAFARICKRWYRAYQRTAQDA